MANAYTIKETPESTDSVTISNAAGAIFKATLGSLPGASSAIGGYVDPPVYSDSSGIKGQYSFDAEYIYMCIADNSWDRFPVTWDEWGTSAPENPVVLSATIDVSGGVLSILFDRDVLQGSGYLDSDFNLDASVSGSNISIAYSSGDGTDTHVYSVNIPIQSGEVVNLDYNGRSGGIEDFTGNDLAEIIDMAVTNNSENSGENYDDILFWDGFDGIIDGTTYTSSADDYPVTHTGTLSGTHYTYIAMDTATKKAGEKSIHFPDDNNYACAVTFGLDGKPTNHNGRFGFWFNYSSPNIAYAKQFATLRESSVSTSTRFIVAGVDTSNPPTRIRVFYYFGNTQYVSRLITINPTTFKDLWLFLEVAWSPSQMNVYMNGVLIDTYDYAFSGFTETSLAQFVLGGTPTGMYVDNLIISNDPNRDLYALALLEAYPG